MSGGALADLDFLRVRELMRDSDAVFVFGSNAKGVHGGGAALAAAKHYGAKHGVGHGRQGRSYAIPTKNTWREGGLPLSHIAAYVDEFIAHAKANLGTAFVVTRVGCGRAGYTDAEIAPLFRDAPENCYLPPVWRSHDDAR